MTAAGYIEISNWDLAIGSLLIFLNGAMSLALRLGVEGRLLIAAARMVIQLSLIGLVLRLLFWSGSPWLTATTALVMILFAGREVMARQERRFRGWWSYGIGTAAMLVAATTVTLFALGTQLKPDPWYDPRYAIPLLGMVLGNTMTGISLGLHTLTSTAYDQRRAIEAHLALGHERAEAFGEVARSSLKSALIPIVNAMAATGVVFLPGMMTGQILAGVEPEHAVRYQLLIMFLIAGGTGIGAVLAVLSGVYRLSDARVRLRLDRLSESR